MGRRAHILWISLTSSIGSTEASVRLRRQDARPAEAATPVAITIHWGGHFIASTVTRERQRGGACPDGRRARGDLLRSRTARRREPASAARAGGRAPVQLCWPLAVDYRPGRTSRGLM